VEALRWFWDVGVLLVLSVVGVGALVGACFEKVSADSQIFCWRDHWHVVPALLFVLDDVVAGDEPTVVRASKGIIVVTLASASAVTWIRRGIARHASRRMHCPSLGDGR
jgi:hypothetical protein